MRWEGGGAAAQERELTGYEREHVHDLLFFIPQKTLKSRLRVNSRKIVLKSIGSYFTVD